MKRTYTAFIIPGYFCLLWAAAAYIWPWLDMLALAGLAGSVLIAIRQTLRSDREPVERQRDALFLAIMLTAVLAGEVVGMLFLQDPPGKVEIDRMAGVAALGSLAGLILGFAVDSLYVSWPKTTVACVLVVICLLCAGVGGVAGWIPGVINAPPHMFRADERLLIIQTHVLWGVLIGFAVGMLVAVMAWAMNLRG